jgi:glycosyltransferase involved in cell wall biosynthesis
MPPILSIVVPNYNHARELPALLQSICDQDFKDLEVIVVDDCSEIPCDDVVDAFSAKGLSVRLIKSRKRIFTKNARLLGVKHAQGDIIACADCDDIFYNASSLGVHVNRFIAEKPDILHFNAAWHGGDTFLNGPYAEYLEGNEIFATAVKIYQNTVWGRLYTRDLWLRIASVAWTLPVKRYSEDILLTALLTFHARRYVGSTIVGYRHHFPGEDKRHKESMERAVYDYVMLTQLVPYLAAQQCPEKILKSFSWRLAQSLRLQAGRFCKHIYEETGFLSDETLKAMLQLADEQAWIKILALGNGMNATNLVSIFRATYNIAQPARLTVTPDKYYREHKLLNKVYQFLLRSRQAALQYVSNK